MEKEPLQFRVEKIEGANIECTVVIGGELSVENEWELYSFPRVKPITEATLRRAGAPEHSYPSDLTKGG